MPILYDLGNGQFRMQGNEIIIDAKDADAAKFRVGSRYVPGECGGGGAYSWDLIQEVHEGNRRVEAAVLVGGFNGRTGEVGLCIWNGRDPGDIRDEDQKKVVEFRPDEIEFRVPIKAPNFTGGGGAPSEQLVGRMWAPNGLSFTQQQSDGNFVTYLTQVPFNIASTNVKAVWSAWTGPIK